MASGFQGAMHKLAATLHAYALGRADLQSLDQFLDTFASITTDMGTEFSFSDMHATPSDLLPAWLRLAPDDDAADMEDAELMRSDVECDMEAPPEQPSEDMRDSEHPAGSDDGDGVGRFAFRYSLAVPGLLHIVHNLCKDIHSCYPEWGTLWDQLKNIEALLTKKFRRNRFR
eukprot:14993444-Alexandrium_andersonii.AAC.1